MSKNQYAYTAQEKINHVKDYLDSGLSAIKFQEKTGIYRQTIAKWHNMYRHQIEYGIPEDETLKGVSRYESWKDEDGNYQAQWVKTDLKLESVKESLRQFCDGLKDEIPHVPLVRPPADTDDDLLTAYILTDAHIGMRSDEWNIEIAERMIKAWADEAVRTSPKSHTAVFVLQGDTGHFDSLKPITPASGHVLDADCDARTMSRVIARVLRYAVERMLSKHTHVKIVYAIGNHDEYSAVITSEWISILYENEPRVSVDTTGTLYHCIEWGLTSLFFHHGHKRKLNEVSKVFAGLYREIFGRTKYSYGHIGHYHTEQSTSDQLMKVDLHPTLSGQDDYAKFGGWLSKRAANIIFYSKKYGERGRVTIPADLLI